MAYLAANYPGDFISYLHWLPRYRRQRRRNKNRQPQEQGSI